MIAQQFYAVSKLKEAAEGNSILFDEYEVIYEDLRDVILDFIRFPAGMPTRTNISTPTQVNAFGGFYFVVEERKLTKKEAAVLKLLCAHLEQTLPRELVLNMVWGDDSYFLGRSLDVFISRLRKYLSHDPAVRILNVHGVGFKLQVE